ncbi:RNA polymerase sigma factor [Spirosoma spitsbergense]|uniref:RNA polymerase sigma factor n=1 Tax=Spirosoma spitsbergense TaxID=431554 RepID=UPI00036C7812|nr:sigma-70 family RNA polymerase sigma factor [Spirosoma spitsbergense]
MATHQYITDQQGLYQSLLAGHDSAFEYLYKALHHRVGGFVYTSGGNREDIKIVVHEAIIALVFNLRYGHYEWREETQLLTYVTGIARNKWSEMRRSKNRYVALDADTPIPISDDPQQTDMEEQDFEQRRLNVSQGLAQLGDKCRQSINLYYIQKKTMSEIASLLGWANENVAKKEKYRCLKKLRQLMGLTNWAD